MPLSGIASPEQLKVLKAALEDHCRASGILAGTSEYEHVAWHVMTLFSQGIFTPEKLVAALAGSSRDKTTGV